MFGLKGKKKLFFLHVPKCGGISIDAALRSKYRSSQIFRLEGPASARAAEVYFDGEDVPREHYADVLAFREAVQVYAMSRRSVRYVSGHFAFSEKAFRRFHGDWVYLTVLRDPARRWLSHYFYNRYKDRDEPHCNVSEDIETMLDSERGHAWGTEYVKYYGGVRADADYRSEASVQAALTNLQRFDVVGALEQMDAFTARVHEVLGTRITVPRKNKSPVSAEFRREIVTDEIRARIDEVCSPDRVLYEAVVGKA